MKKCFLIICIAIICSLLFAIFASAHPGKTDSYGGHYDHSTGGYHYHHGYSAHNHYDIDGDGDIDCPYKFKDNTNHSNSSNNNYSNTDNKTEANSEPLSKLTFGDILIMILKIIVISFIFLIVGLIGWGLVYAGLTLLLSWICEKILKIDANESVIGKISIIAIVVVVIIIASNIVLDSEGLF